MTKFHTSVRTKAAKSPIAAQVAELAHSKYVNERYAAAASSKTAEMIRNPLWMFAFLPS